MASAQEQITEIAKDLLSLEINTILSPSIIAAKMPPPYVTLRDIALLYSGRDGLQLNLLDDIIDAAGETDLDAKRTKFRSVYKQIKDEAKRQADLRLHDETKEMIYWRIIDASGKIANIMNELAGGSEFTSDQLVKIRKIWELGLDVVIMQTGVQLDGDVFVRIHPKYATQENQTLFSIHHESVNVSIKFWGELVSIVMDFFNKIIKTFFSTK